MKKVQQTKEFLQKSYQANLVNNLNRNHSSQIVNAAADGCFLHQLYLDNSICEEHFHAGLAFAKLYGLAMRSFGIHNRVKSACQTWDQIYGITYDSFSNNKIEALWRYIMKALDPVYHDELNMQEIAFSLVLTTNNPKELHIKNIKKTLQYLQTVWEKIEAGPYKLGLFAKQKNKKLFRLN
ncbi:MAG: hypothetical protein NT128_06035 [Proteobacteria bacterium]|nr:hypothetical protein [Pseudomonadota bacterium]